MDVSQFLEATWTIFSPVFGGIAVVIWQYIKRRSEDKAKVNAKRDLDKQDQRNRDEDDYRKLLRDLRHQHEQKIADLEAVVVRLRDDLAKTNAERVVSETREAALRDAMLRLQTELEAERTARRQALEEANGYRLALDGRNDQINELLETVRLNEAKIASLSGHQDGQITALKQELKSANAYIVLLVDAMKDKKIAVPDRMAITNG